MHNFFSPKEFNKKETLTKILQFGLFCFFTNVYWLIDGGDATRIFYIIILFPCVLLSGEIYKTVVIQQKTFIFLFLLFPFYLATTHLWAADEYIKKSILFHLRSALCVTALLVTTLFVFYKKESHYLKLVQSLIFIGTLSSFISIIYYFYNYNLSHALTEPFTSNSNKAGAIYFIHFTICFLFALTKDSRKKHSLTFYTSILGCILSISTVYFTQTLVPLLLLPILLGLTLVWKKKHCTLLLCFLITVLCFLFSQEITNTFFASSRVQVRIQLILESIQQTKDSPFFGLGLTHKMFLDNPPLTRTYPHPHNIFIDVFRFGGLLGIGFLFLHIGTITYTFLKSAKITKNKQRNILVILFSWYSFGLIFMTFYAQQPLTRPGGYIWFLYWIPAILLFSNSLINLRNTKRPNEPY